MYKLIANPSTNIPEVVRRDDDGVFLFIPMNKENTDYQRYLRWLEEGNTPEPADPLPPEPTPEEKLTNAGLTVDELKQLLGLN
jgi:hypothetical protein